MNDISRRSYAGLATGVLFGTRAGLATMGIASGGHDASEIDGDQGYVMLQFDDYPDESHVDLALPIMDDHDVPGVVGVKTGLTNSEDELDGLDDLTDAGWEAASHTVDHTDLVDASHSKAREQLRESREWLDDHGYSTGDTSVIYPYGSVNEEVADIARDYFTFGFGGDDDPPGWEDPLAIGRVRGHEPNELEPALDRAADDGETVVVMCHEIVESGASKNEIEVDDLESTAERIASDDDLEPIVPTEYETLLDEGPQ